MGGRGLDGWGHDGWRLGAGRAGVAWEGVALGRGGACGRWWVVGWWARWPASPVLLAAPNPTPPTCMHGGVGPHPQGIKLGVSSRGWASLRTDPKQMWVGDFRCSG
jgi:hypothetical protein